MKALVEPSGRVAQIAANEFPVAGDLRWIGCDNTVTTRHVYDGANFIAPVDAPFVQYSAAELSRRATFQADPDRIDLISRLKTATPDQIGAWVDANVTTIATARTLLKAIVKVIALDVRA